METKITKQELEVLWDCSIDRIMETGTPNFWKAMKKEFIEKMCFVFELEGWDK